MKAARRGEWRVVGLMLDRVFGKPRESITVETEEPEVLQELRAMTPEERQALLRQWNTSAGDLLGPAVHAPVQG